uniref:Chromosome X open reading frame 66 n=1 Tax=Piliocolobus tephrosceles TaxID=591936 RepID=A0A8C9HU50_9PRIM
MNLVICVLLLSIWTNNCMTTNQTNGSSTTGNKTVESMQTKLNDLRRNLLILVGINIMAFVFICFCYLHYNCLSDDASKAGMVKNKGIAAKLSKTSFNEAKAASQCSPETQPMLSTVDKLSDSSSSERSPTPSSTEKLIKPSSLQKPSIPNSAGKLTRPSKPKRSSRSSRSENLRKSSHLEKAHKGSPEKSRKLDYACNPASSDKPVRPPRLSKPLCSSHPQKQTSPSKPLSPKELAKPPKHFNPKRSVSPGRAALLSNSKVAETCQSYKKKHLVSKTYKPLVNDISEAKEKNTQNLYVSSKVKSSPRSFRKLDSRSNAYDDHVNDSDMMSYYSEDDSDKDIIITCDRGYNEFTSEVTLND